MRNKSLPFSITLSQLFSSLFTSSCFYIADYSKQTCIRWMNVKNFIDRMTQGRLVAGF